MKELTKTCLIGINHGNVFFLISKRLGVNESYRTPLIVAARHNDEAIINGADCIDTIRLFADSIDFSGGFSSGWEVLENLFTGRLLYDKGVYIDNSESFSPLVWILRLSASDIRENLIEGGFPFLLALELLYQAPDIASLLLTLTGNPINARWGLERSALHSLFAFASWSNGLDNGLNLILNGGADLHLVEHESIFSPRSETATSLALYCSFTFMKWRGALLRSAVDLESFVEDEVQQNPLKDAGWNKDSLLALFHCDIQSDQDVEYCCEDCSGPINFLGVELPWRQWLDRFKEKTNENSSKVGQGGIERHKSNCDIVGPKSPSLEIEGNFRNAFLNQEEVAEETTTSDLSESEAETEVFDAYFGGKMGFVCMRCYGNRQEYVSESDSESSDG